MEGAATFYDSSVVLKSAFYESSVVLDLVQQADSSFVYLQYRLSVLPRDSLKIARTGRHEVGGVTILELDRSGTRAYGSIENSRGFFAADRAQDLDSILVEPQVLDLLPSEDRVRFP